MKNKFKNIIITILFSILCICLVVDPSEAKDISGKEKVTVAVRKTDDYDVHLSGLADGTSDDTFCVQEGAHVETGNEYTVKNRIEIDGLKSVVYEGNGDKVVKTVENDLNNGIMAWILAQKDTGSDHVVKGGTSYSPKQKAIYGFFETWKNTNGLENYKSKSGGYSYSNWVTKGKEYASTIKNGIPQASIEDKTDVSKIKTEMYKYDNKDYAKVGPFKFEYSGTLDELKVYNQKGKEIDVKIAVYSGNELKVLDDNNKVKSNKSFYVLVKDDGETKTIKVAGNVSQSYPKYKATIWTLSHKYYENGVLKEGQNIITTIASKEPQNSEADVETKDVPVPFYIDISGYVWVDKAFGKGELGKTNRNDLYRDGDTDVNDVAVNGITVRLKDNSGNIIATTNTKELGIYSEIDGGEYIFKELEASKLNNYYVEFEYNGLTYTNVIAHTDKNNGSKAIEIPSVRNNLNNQFTEVTAGTNRNVNANVQATTSQIPYNLKTAYDAQGGGDLLKYVNLGLVTREQPKYGLGKDLYNVKLSVNGFNHTYTYDQNKINEASLYERDNNDFNVGVRFGRDNKVGSYYRAIYKSDATYVNDSDKSKELSVYLTYRIALQNYSGLQGQINSILEYYDQRYEYVGASAYLKETAQGSGVYEVDNTRFVEANTQDYNTNGYKKVVINTSSVGKIDKYSSKSVYVQFKMSKEAVLDLLNNRVMEGSKDVLLQNVAEINSYTTFDSNGNVYAGYDPDSTPGNAVPGNEATYEDDTGVAPSFKLQFAEERTISGKVFLDEIIQAKLQNENIRQGSGTYEDNEKGIPNVTVKLIETSGSGIEDKVATTNENGDFEFTDIVAGEYKIVYIWGDETYTVQNYKGTVYDSTRNQNDKNWYKIDEDTRKTDAIDNYETRLEIDNELKEVINSSKATKTKMDSYTPVMGIGIEETTDGNTKYGVSSIETETDGDRFIPKGFTIRNLDFGIVERPKQDLALSKRVKSMKVMLANGQTIVNFTIDENGKLSGEHNHIAYMPKDGSGYNGFVKLELDNELIQGTNIEVEYEIKATNRSELDYNSSKFYNYGIIDGEVVTITPSAIVDYLDNSWAFNKDKNAIWSEIKLDEFKNNTGLIDENVFGTDSEINSRTILITTELANKALKPSESNAVSLNVSKTLANSDEINLDNEVETIKVVKNGGSKLVPIPGNYVPGNSSLESDEDRAEEVIVTPSTGDNLDYILPIAVGLIALSILGTGVTLISKKVLGTKK